MSAVTLEEVKDSEDGFQYWCEVSIAPKSGYAGSSAGTSAGQTHAKADRTHKADKADRTPQKAKAKAAPKPGAANVENEKAARTLLATFQLAQNSMARVNAAADESTYEWNWAGQDMEQFKNEEMSLHQLWQKGKMTAFVQDLRAAVFSPSAVRAFKKRYDAEYGPLMKKFVTESEPKIALMQSIVGRVEDTASVRGITGFEQSAKKSPNKRARSSDA